MEHRLGRTLRVFLAILAAAGLYRLTVVPLVEPRSRTGGTGAEMSAEQEQAINGERPALLQLSGLFGQPAVAMAGGLPLQLNGQTLGAVGVSGMTPEVDGAIGAAGVAVLAALSDASTR